MFFYIIYIPVLVFILLLALSAIVHAVYLIPFVPSRKRVVAKMIEAARLSPNEKIVDLGCGDGRILFAAEKAAPGISVTGFEIAPLMIALALTAKLIKQSRLKLRFQSLFQADLRNANVIFCYLFPSAMKRLAKKILNECKPGTRIISNTFSIPDLRHVKTYPREANGNIPSIHVYTV